MDSVAELAEVFLTTKDTKGIAEAVRSVEWPRGTLVEPLLKTLTKPEFLKPAYPDWALQFFVSLVCFVVQTCDSMRSKPRIPAIAFLILCLKFLDEYSPSATTCELSGTDPALQKRIRSASERSLRSLDNTAEPTRAALRIQ